MTDRQTIIEILMATRGMSEGQTADAILSALTAPRVPEGWKLVPRHPDGAMGEAAYDAEMKALHHGEPASFIDIWQAMYDEAPMITAAPATSDTELARLRERAKVLEERIRNAARLREGGV